MGSWLQYLKLSTSIVSKNNTFICLKLKTNFYEGSSNNEGEKYYQTQAHKSSDNYDDRTK